MACVFHEGLRVHILGLTYAARERTGRIYAEASESIDEIKIVKFFQKIDPNIKHIEFYHENVLVFVLSDVGSYWEVYYAN